MKVEFVSHANEVKAAFAAACLKALEECGLVGEGYAKKGCAVDTGELRNSITHAVDEAEPAVYIGTNNEHGPYVELGTGEHYPGGRQDSWVYQDAKGNWHRTAGQKAQPYLKPAVADHPDTYRGIIERELKNG